MSTEIKVPDPLVVREEVGISAKELLRKRRNGIRRKMVRTYIVLSILLFAVFGGTGLYVKQILDQPGKRYVDYRTCKYHDEKNDITVTGKRKYSYLERKLFGFQFRNSKDTTEQTEIDVVGTSMTIVGLSDGKWYSAFVGPGERGIEILKQHELYVVTMGKKVAVFDYHGFCM